MHKLTTLAILLVGCTSAPATKQSSTESARQSATQPILRSIDLHYGIYLARLDIHTTITSDGMLRSSRTDKKSYGPNDFDPKHERYEIREGRLSPQQVSELANLFVNWDSLASERYNGVPDGGAIAIRYGDKIVSGGSGAPKQVWDVKARIDELTATMQIVK